MQHNYTCKSESFVLFDIFLSWRNEKNHNKQKKDFFGFLFTPAVTDSWKLHGTMEPTPRLSMKTLVHGMWISLLTGHDTSRSGEVDSTWVNTPLKRRIWCTKKKNLLDLNGFDVTCLHCKGEAGSSAVAQCLFILPNLFILHITIWQLMQKVFVI